MEEQLRRIMRTTAASVESHTIGAQNRSIPWIIFALACTTLATAIVAYYPIQPGLFAAALIAYAMALWRWQWLWLLMVPTVIPAVDFAFWTGLIDVSEADAVVLVTLAVLICKAP